MIVFRGPILFSKIPPIILSPAIRVVPFGQRCALFTLVFLGDLSAGWSLCSSFDFGTDIDIGVLSYPTAMKLYQQIPLTSEIFVLY